MDKTNFFTVDSDQQAVAVLCYTKESWENQSAIVGSALAWATLQSFEAKPGQHCLIPTEAGDLACVLLGVDVDDALWSAASLPKVLPEGLYRLVDETQADFSLQQASLGWGLGCYAFEHYCQEKKSFAQLVVAEAFFEHLEQAVTCTFAVRNRVNSPAELLGPEELSIEMENLAKAYGASFNAIVGDDLLKENYPAIHAVGRASHRQPRLLDLIWGDANQPLLTLVGKGVCFDSGGLDLKPASGMRIMKKDMGGAAHILGLAQWIMMAKLPVRLRVLIPAVENAIGPKAYRPGDVLTMRNGLTVEVDNTDAEGRLVLADALTVALEEKPDLLLDYATLTGAARVALGPDLPALFSNVRHIQSRIVEAGESCQDAVWPMPLHNSYKSYLDSDIADVANCANSPFGGTITAALFLQQFVGECDWIHIDGSAWNFSSRPGRPKGGEAMGLRALFAFLQARYG